MAFDPDKVGCIGDLASLQRGNTYKSKLLGFPGPVLLGLASIERGGGFRSDNLKTYGGDSPEKLRLYPGDIYVSLKDVTQAADLLGAVVRVPEGVHGRLTQDTVKLVMPDVPKDWQAYLYWLLRTPEYRAFCKSNSMGTTNLSLSREDFLSYPVPPLSVERLHVITALESIESRINHNRALVANLEAIARQLFKSWFVNFDPVCAKAAGEKPTGLADDFASLFPDRFVDSEMGEIPAGWGPRTISDLADVVGGSTPSTKNDDYWINGSHCWATPKDFARLSSPVLLDTERKVTDLGLNQISSGLLPIGTVLLSSRAPIGYLAIAAVPVAINQGFIAMKPKQGVSNLYLFYWAKSAHDTILANANGSTFLEISKKNFRPIPAIDPGVDVMKAFATVVSPLFDQIVCAEREVDVLTQLRDFILPRLISGKIRVADAESLIEETIA